MAPKWRLLVTTLPVPIVAAMLKAALVFGLHFRGILEFSDTAAVLTAGAFLLGFMLSGTMSDYKESEKLPAEFASSLEAMEDVITVASRAKPEKLNRAKLLAELHDLATSCRDWFCRKRGHHEMYRALTAFRSVVLALDEAGVWFHAGAITRELQALRKATTRVNVISRTSFISAGYALLETMVACVIVLLLLARFANPVGMFVVVGTVSLVYVYMLRLIKDLDDPFEHRDDSVADVSLFPIEEYIERLEAVIAEASEPRPDEQAA